MDGQMLGLKHCFATGGGEVIIPVLKEFLLICELLWIVDVKNDVDVLNSTSGGFEGLIIWSVDWYILSICCQEDHIEISNDFLKDPIVLTLKHQPTVDLVQCSPQSFP